MQNEFTFFIYNTLVQSGTLLALKKIVPVTEHPPVIVCIGSDLSIADSLGPICGTKLKDKLNGNKWDWIDFLVTIIGGELIILLLCLF